MARRGKGERRFPFCSLSNLWLALRESFFIFRASAMGKEGGIFGLSPCFQIKF